MKGVEPPPQELDIIQAFLHTLNAKFQNTKIGTILYNVCACACVCVLTGLWNQSLLAC